MGLSSDSSAGKYFSDREYRLLYPTLYPGPRGIEIVPVNDRSSHDAQQLHMTFNAIFPYINASITDLSRYMNPIEHEYGVIVNHCWLIKHHSEPVGIRLFSYIPDVNIGHGAFVGLLPKAQNQGIGSWIVQQTRLQLLYDARHYDHAIPDGYCVEIERFEEARTVQELQKSRRRLQFHLQNGAIILPVSFLEPLLPYWPDRTELKQIFATNLEVQPMELLWYPQLATTMLSPERIRQIVVALYKYVYCVPEELPLVQKVLYSIQQLP